MAWLEAENLVGVRFDSRLYDFLFIAHSRAVEAKQETNNA